MTYKNTNKRDLNEKEIVTYWLSCGYSWFPALPGQGYDGLLLGFQRLYFVENKNPEYPWELTKREAAVRDIVTKQGLNYVIVETLDDAIKLADRMRYG